MLQTNRYVTHNPLNIEFRPFKLPAKELAFALDLQQKNWDEAEGIIDDINVLGVNALSHDRGRANEIIQGYNKQVDDLVTLYGEDYGRANKGLKKIQRQVERDKAPGGKLNSIEANYAALGAWDKEWQGKVGTKEGPTSEDFNLFRSQMLNQYGAQPEVDPSTGAYRALQAGPMASTFAIGTDAFDKAALMSKNPQIIEQWLPDVKLDPNNPGYIIDVKGRRELITPELISTALTGLYANDPKAMSYLKQYYDIRGTEATPEILMQHIQREVMPAAIAFSKDNYTEDVDRTVDWYQQESVRFGHAKALKRYEKELSVDALESFRWRFNNNMSLGSSKEYSTNIFGNAITRGGGLRSWGSQLVDSWGPNTDVRQPGHKLHKDGFVQKSIEELKQQGIKVDELPPDVANKMIMERADNISKSYGQGAPLVLDFGPKTTDAISDLLFKDLRYKNLGAIIIHPDGSTEAEQMGEDALAEFGLKEEDIIRYGRAQGVQAPMAGLPPGIIASAPGMGGDQILFTDMSAVNEDLMSGLQNLSHIQKVGVNHIPGIDLSFVLGSAYGADQGYMTATKDEDGTQHLYNAAGKDLLSPNDFLQPIRDINTLMEIGLMKSVEPFRVHTSGKTVSHTTEY